MIVTAEQPSSALPPSLWPPPSAARCKPPSADIEGDEPLPPLPLLQATRSTLTANPNSQTVRILAQSYLHVGKPIKNWSHDIAPVPRLPASAKPSPMSKNSRPHEPRNRSAPMAAWRPGTPSAHLRSSSPFDHGGTVSSDTEWHRATLRTAQTSLPTWWHMACSSAPPWSLRFLPRTLASPSARGTAIGLGAWPPRSDAENTSL